MAAELVLLALVELVAAPLTALVPLGGGLPVGGG